MLKTVWNYLIEFVKVPPDFETLGFSEGNISAEDVKTISSRFLEEQKWYLLEPRKLELLENIETKRKIWQVTCLLKGVEEEYFTGTMAVLIVDDQTGEIVSKGYTPR